MPEEENGVEELDLEALAQAAIEDECANDPNPDTLGCENGVEGASE